MSREVLVLADSGSGKSTSLTTLDSSRTIYFNCANKEMPYRGGEQHYNKKRKNFFLIDSSTKLIDYLTRLKTAYSGKDTEVNIVIDDLNYLMTWEGMERRHEAGFQKHGDIAYKMVDVFKLCKSFGNNVFIVILAHMQNNEKTGIPEFKSTGKFVSEKLGVAGLFNQVLLMDDEYNFITNGEKPCKTPMGMFKDEIIPNDLQKVKEQMFEYYSKREEDVEIKPSIFAQ